MLTTAVVVAAAVLIVASLALFTLGHRLRRASITAALALSVIGTVAAGEVAARLFRLPSTAVLAAEVGLVAVAALVAILRRAWNPIGVWFFATVTFAAGSYLALAAHATVAGGLTPVGLVVSAVLLALETAALLLACTFAFETCDVLCRTRWERKIGPPDTAYRPFVSLQVAAYNEPPDMLIETIQSLEAIDYPAFEIVVIDNNTTDPEVWEPVEAYCATRDRVRFVHVERWPGFKSGALNLALRSHTDPRTEVVGIVDADYLVKPNWLSDPIGWFADPTVAFVQTPQDYREWEGDGYLTACHDAYAYFFATAMRSRNERNSIIFGGTMGLIRRPVLEEVGGWDEWCITEDAEVSLRILAAGYQGVYIHRSYGEGIMPLTFDALKRQRFRWCFGGVQILRKHWRKLIPGPRRADNLLTRAQRIDYLIGGVQWFIDLVALGFTIVLIGVMITVLAGRPLTFRPFGGPVIALPITLAVSGGLRAVWALRTLSGISGRRAALAFANFLALSWTVGMACAKGLVRRDGVFLRTPKWRGDGGIREALRATRTETALAVTLWSGAAAAVVTQAGPVMPAFAAWQGSLYACAPAMAWLNLRTELSARLKRRQQTEDRRERRPTYQPHIAGATLALLLAGGIALLALGGATATRPGGGGFELPSRDPTDEGPLGNVGVVPQVNPASPATSTTTTGPASPAASTTTTGPTVTPPPPPPGATVPGPAPTSPSPAPTATTRPGQAPTTVTPPTRAPGPPTTTRAPGPPTTTGAPGPPTTTGAPGVGSPTSRSRP